MSDELLKRMQELDEELEAVDQLEERGGQFHPKPEAKPEPPVASVHDTHHPDAGQAEGEPEITHQPNPEGPDAAQAEAVDSGQGGKQEQAGDAPETETLSEVPKGYIPVPEHRRLKRHLSGAEKRAQDAEQRANELAAQLERAKLAGYQPQEPRSAEELLHLANEGDMDAQSELNQLFYQQQQRLQQQTGYPAGAEARLPVFYSEQEQQVFHTLDSVNTQAATQLADWLWAAKPRQGQPQADENAAKAFGIATQIDEQLRKDPAFQWQDEASLLTEVVRRTQQTINQGGAPATPAATPVQSAAPPQKRTPQSLSAAAGVSGVGQSNGGNSVNARYEAAQNKVEFVRGLTDDERELLYE